MSRSRPGEGSAEPTHGVYITHHVRQPESNPEGYIILRSRRETGGGATAQQARGKGAQAVAAASAGDSRVTSHGMAPTHGVLRSTSLSGVSSSPMGRGGHTPRLPPGIVSEFEAKRGNSAEAQAVAIASVLRQAHALVRTQGMMTFQAIQAADATFLARWQARVLMSHVVEALSLPDWDERPGRTLHERLYHVEKALHLLGAHAPRRGGWNVSCGRAP